MSEGFAFGSGRLFQKAGFQHNHRPVDAAFDMFGVIRQPNTADNGSTFGRKCGAFDIEIFHDADRVTVDQDRTKTVHRGRGGVFVIRRLSVIKACGLPINDSDDRPYEVLVSYSPGQLPPMRSGPVPALFS